MAKQVKQYIKNPKYGQPGEPERILFPQTISENGAFLNRMAQIEKLEYNATQVTGNNYNGLAEALASVTNDKYKVKGIVLTWFDSSENQWKSMRYNGADSTGWGEVGNWVEVGGAGGASEHTLDLSPLFDSEGSPVATVTDEFLVEVKKAYEGKYSNAVFYYYTYPIIVPLQIASADGNYQLLINFNGIANSSDFDLHSYIWMITPDKNVQFQVVGTIIESSGQGTKALTDNGKYAEFATPIKTQDGGTGAVTKELQPNTFYKFGECSSLTITLASEKSGILNEYMFEFISGSTPTTLTDIPNVKWQNGDKLTPEANCTYQVSIVNNCAVYVKFSNN